MDIWWSEVCPEFSWAVVVRANPPSTYTVILDGNPGQRCFACRPRPEVEIQTADVGTGFSSLSRVKTR